MDIAFTFGSLGDIIQLCQLAIQLGRAVGIGGAAVNGNSCQEYQQLRDDLDLFVGVLMQASHALDLLHRLCSTASNVKTQTS